MSITVRVAVLTVSDTAAQDATADKSGPTIKDVITNQGFTCAGVVIVPDDVVLIQKQVKQWCRGDIDWIITTGGTGFGVRDKTPEAISPLLEREASGLVHFLISTSLKHTPLAALSRPVAGTIKNTLVVTLPGSVKAVKENLEALFHDGVIHHTIDLIKGGTGREVHAQLSSNSGAHVHVHHHAHHPHHVPHPHTIHDPSNPVSARHRVSPYPLISLEQALDVILREVNPLGTCKHVVSPALTGHILAEDIFASQNIPVTATSNVDGYALRSTYPPGIYKVLTSSNHQFISSLPPNSIYRVNTGGPLPPDTDAVIMVEDTKLVSTYVDNGEEKEVETLTQVSAKENVRASGSDIRQGDLVLHKGERILGSGGEIGTIAFVGRKEVEVYKKPTVALLSTGDELIDLHSTTAASPSSDNWTGIWDTNRPSLQSALENLGYAVIDLGIVSDNVTAHVNAIQNGLDKADLILTTGGTSMGPSDLLKPVIERNFKGMIHFGRVTVKPGKPTTFATIPVSGSVSKPLFALPGNPASALVTFYIFVVPALRKLGGWPMNLCQLPRIPVKLHDAMPLDHRTEFHRAIIRSGPHGLEAFSTGGQRSSRVASLNGANGFVVLPQKTGDTPMKLEVGTLVDAVIIGELLN